MVNRSGWVAALAAIALLPSLAPSQAAAATDGDGRVPAFYSAAAKGAGVGRIFKREPLEPALMLSGASRGERILYTTRRLGAEKGVAAASGAIFLPKGAPPKGGWPVIAWAHGTVGVADVCAPSIQGRSLRDIDYLNRWLSEGFAIVATDYRGLGTPGSHPYLDARAAAYDVLDSVRAAQHDTPSLGRQVVIVGQSQGGHSAVAAAVLAKTYAPELDIRGVVATGTPYVTADMSTDAYLQDTRPTYELLMYLLIAAQQMDPRMTDAALINPAGLALYNQAATVCVSRFESDIRASGLTTALGLTTEGLRSALPSVIKVMAYPSLVSAIPIFMGIGEKDASVPAEIQLRLARDACAVGTVVEAHLYPALSHGEAVGGSLADSLPFVRKVMKGEAITPRCGSAP